MTETVRLEAELLAQFADAQPAGSISAQDARDLIVSSKYLTNHGWQFYLDTATAASPTAVSGGTRHELTIDGAVSTIGHPALTPAFWNVSSNKINPTGLNDFGLVRIAFTAESVGVTNRLDVELDVSGLANGTGSPSVNGDIIYQQTAVFDKGAGTPQFFNFEIPLFAGPNFIANGGTIYVTPTGDMNIYTKAITAIRLYGASPAV